LRLLMSEVTLTLFGYSEAWFLLAYVFVAQEQSRQDISKTES
jgi:hypothetical protein